MVYCKACGEELGPPEEEVFVEKDGEPDMNPDGHLKQVSGSKGTRLQCRQSGQMTKAVDKPPGQEQEEEPNDGGTPSPNANEKSEQSGTSPQPDQSPEPEPSSPQQQQKQQKKKREEVYDIAEEKEAIDVLRETIQNPTYELNESQITEIEDWAEIYDGHIPPNLLEDVCSNMSGVAKQTAQLMRQKYEAKLNRWVRDSTERDQGPPIGAVPNPPSGGGMTPQRAKQLKRQKEMASGGNQNPSPPPSGNGGTSSGPSPNNGGSQPERDKSSRPIAKRQERAFDRRQDAIDQAIEAAAPQMAEEMTARMGQSYDLIMTIMKSKAQKDPDWFFEKMDALGVSLDDLAEPSEAKKREMNGSGGATDPDSKMDQVLDEMSGESEPSRTPDPTEQTQQREPEPEPKPQPSSPDPEPLEEKTDNTGPHWGGDDEETEPDDEEIDPELDELMDDINNGE